MFEHFKWGKTYFHFYSSLLQETVLEQKEKSHNKYQQLPAEDDRRLEEFLSTICSRNFVAAEQGKLFTQHVLPRNLQCNAPSLRPLATLLLA